MEKSKKYEEFANDAAKAYKKWQDASKEEKIDLWAKFELISQLRDSFQCDRHVGAPKKRKTTKKTDDGEKKEDKDKGDDKDGGDSKKKKTKKTKE